MNDFKGQYDFSQKLKWNPAYIAEPGTGPDMKMCNTCIHFGHDIEKGSIFPKTNDSHFYFCNQVLVKAGLAKAINKETAACSVYKERKRGAEIYTTKKAAK